ncbi:MAG: CHAD domain-containing protein [Planctomycetia bacterium]|jgi:CHAD domain-containing protein|nr:CHAD domain-containing protein [Planctomycetia bacterium]MCC7316181.1 CHAD domain-containing protein [Planctomycetota bacterium]OQY97348.1 MAG: hypothetical protein B6D36_18675 [Planctomycetes bacterium UTPLA1]
MSDSVKASVCISLAAYVEKQAKRFSSNLEKVVASGDVDGVHDVRVASRRLVQPLRLMSAWLGGKPIKRPAGLLRATRQTLAKVRDLDVLLASLCGSEATWAHGLEPSDLARLEGALTRRRQRLAKKAINRLARQKPQRAAGLIWRLSDKMLDVVDEESDLVLAHQVERLFEKSLERLVHRDPRGDQKHDLHETRICVKRARYAGELMRDVGLRRETDLLKALVGMQDRLGRWNDQLIAISYVTREARRPKVLAEDAAWSARVLSLAADWAKEADAGQRRILDVWAEFDTALRACFNRYRDRAQSIRAPGNIHVS